jgi:cytochrome c oxidase subunit IV
MNEHATRKAYFLVYGVLIALTAFTTAMAYVDLGAFNIYVALTIALVKGTLVVLFFMHVRESSGMTRVYVAAGFFWLAILMLLTITDYISRSWLPS